MGENFNRLNAHERHEQNQQFISSANVAAIELSAITLKALLLLNGGAAVAMLGFVASVSSSLVANQVSLAGVVRSLQMFSCGAALAVLATGLAYVVMYLQAAVAQAYELSQDPPYVRGTRASTRIDRVYVAFHILSVVVACASLILFISGVFYTGDFVVQSVSK